MLQASPWFVRCLFIWVCVLQYRWKPLQNLGGLNFIQAAARHSQFYTRDIGPRSSHSSSRIRINWFRQAVPDESPHLRYCIDADELVVAWLFDADWALRPWHQMHDTYGLIRTRALTSTDKSGNSDRHEDVNEKWRWRQEYTWKTKGRD